MRWLQDPRSRRRYAIILLFVTLVLGHANVAGYMFGWVPHSVMDAITNYLSWLALSITALDVVLTADVRVEQDES